MPEHTTFLHYLLASSSALRNNAANVGNSALGGHPVEYRGLEPVVMALIVMVVVIWLAGEVRSTYRHLRESTVPEDSLTLRTFFEVFFSFFYNMTKDVMGEERAKRFFPIIGSAAIFIFISNALGLIPGFNPPTASLNITLGSGLVVFVAFNLYGIREVGLGNYLKHLCGPNIFLAPLMFVVETISLCVRPFTLAIRLMLNMAVDHMLVAIFLGLVAWLLPVPLFFLGIIVIAVQTLVFCLLTSIYIALATEKHEEAHH